MRIVSTYVCIVCLLHFYTLKNLLKFAKYVVNKPEQLS